MARSGIGIRKGSLIPFNGGGGESPQTSVQPLEFFREEKGMNLKALPNSNARGGLLVQNVEIVDDVLQGTYLPATVPQVGSNTAVVGVHPHRSMAGVQTWIICKTGGGGAGAGVIEKHTQPWTGTPSSTTITGAGVTFTTATKLSFVTWGDTVLICDGATGLIIVDVTANTYTISGTAPIGRFISVIGNRVVITGIANQPARVQWSVKNDSTDWTGLGSGFEDLRVLSSGAPENLGPTKPYDETFSFLFGEVGVYGITETSYFDAPFRFSLLEGFEGTLSPWSVARVPEGICYVGHTNVWLINRQQSQPIDTPILDHIKDMAVNQSRISGAYNGRRHAYVLTTPCAGVTNVEIYQCHLMAGNQWTRMDWAGIGGGSETEILSVFEYPEVDARTGTTPYRTQMAGYGFFVGTSNYFLSLDRRQFFNIYTQQSSVKTIRLDTVQVVPSDPSRQFVINEIQLICAPTAGETYTWTPTIVHSGSVSTTLPAITIPSSKNKSFEDSTEDTKPIRWLYSTVACRQTITTETLLIKNSISISPVGTNVATLRIYGLRVFVTEEAKTYE